MDAILPAAGSASRLRGLPKFLLPARSDFLTLIERHIESLTDLVNTIWIPTRQDFVPLLDSLNFDQNKVRAVVIESQTMTDTLQQTCLLSEATDFLIGMPDTYLEDQTAYKNLSLNSAPLSLALWEIRASQKGKLGQVQIATKDFLTFATEILDKEKNCNFPHIWGAFKSSKDLILSADLHFPPGEIFTDYLASGESLPVIINKGKYFDCGTPSEYFELLSFIS